MQTVEIVDHEMILTEFHCPFCGASTLSKGSVESCQHLIYVTHDETFDEPWFGDNEGLWPTEDDEDLYISELLERQYPGADTLLVILSEPPISPGSTYILYRFPNVVE